MHASEIQKVVSSVITLKKVRFTIIAIFEMKYQTGTSGLTWSRTNEKCAFGTGCPQSIHNVIPVHI
jgi:hypothetical protein